MFCFNKMSTPAIALLLMATLLPVASFAKDSGAKGAAKEQSKEQSKEQAKDQVKPAASQTVVRINGTAITRLDVDRAVKVMLAQNQIEQPLPPESMKEAESAALEQLTSAEILYQEASKLAIKDLDKQIAEKVAQNRSKFKSDAEFEEALKGIDMTAKDLHDFTRKDIVINNFIQTQFASKATATEAEAKKFYDDNMEQYFKKPEVARASHILIGIDEKATAEERKKAKEKAEALLKRIKGGEDFAAIAKSDSSCPSASQGGDLGVFGRGQMVPPFEDAAFGLKPGEVSGVVETQFGYHIIKLVDKQASSAEKFENVKDKITEFLKKEKMQKELSAFIDQLRKTAKIEQEKL
ncbi:MAG TPA: peptidylprolyl isomerase [Geobacter sp.]|nr:peptidylprolyl isomerase [Geobacter sp.]